MIPTARYFPLRFHCVRALNAMARATRAFIPVAPLVLEVLDSQYVKGAPKKGTAKPPLFAYIYKVRACGGLHGGILSETCAVSPNLY